VEGEANLSLISAVIRSSKEVKMLTRLFNRKRARRILVIVSALVIVSILATSTGLVSLAQKGTPPPAGKPQPPAQAQEPLTDVAGPPPVVDVKADENPQARLKALGLDTLPAVDKGKQPSDVMDLAHPPQWTQTIAAPGAPQPPDPFKAPPMAINPMRGQPDDASLKPAELPVEPKK
jgi:hypothetical protein